MASPFDKLTFLIVEDNKPMRGLVREILEALGVGTILEAADGQAALKQLGAHTVDIVILDWNMEPMDGLELTRRIRTAPDSPDQYVPIIMLSGHTERARVIAARDAGVTEFMAKPVSVKALCARINAIIDAPRPFIRTGSYFGPDRRRRVLPFNGPDRRSESAAQKLEKGPRPA
jgi:two-component system, chemotaxis family, chemotaxis protein CheY